MDIETKSYMIIDGDVVITSDDPERVKFIREALGARYDWNYWKAEYDSAMRGWNNEGEQHRVTRQALEDLQKRYEAGLYNEAEPLRERLGRIREAIREVLDDAPDVTFDRQELPPVGPPVKEDPENPKPLA